MSVAESGIALFSVPKEICRDFEHASRLEWLDTNHTGSFSMGTVAGVNTRRYHGLLIGSSCPPADRVSILPRLEESVHWNSQNFELATVQYPGAVHPRGFELLDGFAIDPFPRWRYRLGSNVIEKSVCMLEGKQSVLIRYEALERCQMRVRPCLAFRDYHGLTHRNSSIQRNTDTSPGRIAIQLYPGMPVCTIFHSGRSWEAEGIWFLEHEYLRELDRGLDFTEDLFSPGSITFDLLPAQAAWLLTTIDCAPFEPGIRDTEFDLLFAKETEHRRLTAHTPAGRILERALDQFRITRHDGAVSLIAGYPWFTDWSRDSLISLPALSIGKASNDEPRAILENLLKCRRRGLLPNRFSDRQSQPEYNSVDASLWAFIAGRDLVYRTNDIAFVRNVLYPAARDIIEWYRRGTDYEIRVDAADHLLSAGTPETQLTWMDAKVGGQVITSRHGKPVEINALWYNALRTAAAWAGTLQLTREQHSYEAEADAMRTSFETKFWNPDRRCLYDVVTDGTPDSSIRPNQLFALSLPFPLVSRGRAQSIVNIVREKLLTPVGVRTLDPDDNAYHPRFQGSAMERDSAYHQGTVWPWLMGPFIAAYLFAYGESDEVRSFCRALAAKMSGQLTACCLGSLSEVYDADTPRNPGGCPAQLWSVAQLTITLERLGI
ncbi:MAG TPA: amylo-alpha-1,6-glucosidase [Bryobacteraceae bacterium]|nr:amylo-alpha-1,6-glucosidase [Bryobacteraceae bacterium]